VHFVLHVPMCVPLSNCTFFLLRVNCRSRGNRLPHIFKFEECLRRYLLLQFVMNPKGSAISISLARYLISDTDCSSRLLVFGWFLSKRSHFICCYLSSVFFAELNPIFSIPFKSSTRHDLFDSPGGSGCQRGAAQPENIITDKK